MPRDAETPAPVPPVAVRLRVNGQDHDLLVEPRTTLLDALRERLRLTGTKKGCDHGQCGCCTVHVNGTRVMACLTLAVMHGRDDEGGGRDHHHRGACSGRRAASDAGGLRRT